MARQPPTLLTSSRLTEVSTSFNSNILPVEITRLHTRPTHLSVPTRLHTTTCIRCSRDATRDPIRPVEISTQGLPYRLTDAGRGSSKWGYSALQSTPTALSSTNWAMDSATSVSMGLFRQMEFVQAQSAAGREHTSWETTAFLWAVQVWMPMEYVRGAMIL